MITLGIETSCDETAAAVLQGGTVLSSIVSSSVPLHEKYGGVVPEIASRFHVAYINRVTKKALGKARKTLRDIDLVAVTGQPGLSGSLLVGLTYARALSFSLGIPLVTVDHLRAHIYANHLTAGVQSMRYPFIGVVVSGGHTSIFVCRSLRDAQIIGRTRDDAIGEAFDKVAKILAIGYPGGPKIERYAKHYAAPLLGARIRSKGAIRFPRSYLEDDSFDFSLSGIKTAVLYYVRKRRMSHSEIARIAWSFQEAVFDVLVERIRKACARFRITDVFMGGGVVCNKRLRKKLDTAGRRSGYRIAYPPAKLCLDNAAMIAGLGEMMYKHDHKKGRC